MKPESICLDGATIIVRYAANPNGRSGWWDAATEHKFTYWPQLANAESIVRFASKTRSLNSAQIDQLQSIVKLIPCGNGHSLQVTESLIQRVGGRVRAGGKSPIFLLSPKGRRGSLMIGTNIYHKYNHKAFRVGLSTDWDWLPMLTDQPMDVETFSASRIDS